MIGRVDTVKLIETGEGYHVLRVDIGLDSFILIGDYNEYINYIGEDVQYTTRKDIYKGEITDFINTVASIRVVQTVENKTQIDCLIPSDASNAISNFNVKSLAFGDQEYGCIALLTKYELNSSSKASWADLYMIDKFSKLFVVKLFTSFAGQNYKDVLDNLVNRYVKFDIHYSKYGYQLHDIELVDVEVTVSPEVEVAYQFILEQVKQDDELLEYCTSSNLLEHLKEVLYYEKGYYLVEIASELMLVNTLKSITDIYDMKVLKRLCVTTRGYLLPRASKYSKGVGNSIILSGTSLRKDDVLMQSVDSTHPESKEVKQMYSMVRAMASFLLIKRKGDKDETEKILKSFADNFISTNANGVFF